MAATYNNYYLSDSYDTIEPGRAARTFAVLFRQTVQFTTNSPQNFPMRRKHGTLARVRVSGGNMNSTSDRLRVVARAMPLSLPPIEGALLLFLMIVWLFG